MRVGLSWLRGLADLPAGADGRAVAERLVRAGLEVETVERIGGEVTGPLVVGRVLEVTLVPGTKKPIRWCRVEVGAGHGHPDTPGERGVICGATNFATGDLVVVALPGAVLPGGFAIASRRTYGHVSDGMICSESELGLGDDHDGIVVLPPGTADPGAPAGPVLGLGEEVLDIAVTPDRGYCLSVRGVAREAATAFGAAFADPGTDLPDLDGPGHRAHGGPAGPSPAPGAPQPHPCATEDPAACDLFTLRTVVGLDPAAPTPAWMRRRLRECGMRSVSLAVDVTNYVMLETGQPLHAFDLHKLRGPVVARRARPGEHLETLDHVRRALDPDDLVIADDRGAVGLAGTMGGLETEIDGTSTDIALEAAHFAADVVARTSRRHRLSSEASRRFERGVDRAVAPFASARAAALLVALGGARHVGMTAVEAPREPVVVALPADLPGRTAGLPLPVGEVVASLRAVGCAVEDPGGGAGAAVLEVRPPSWRPDLADPADLVEEVVRLHGYGAIPSTLPRPPAGRGLTREQRLRRRVGRAMAGAGYTEVLSYPFVGAGELDGLRLGADDARRRTVRLANPLSDEQPLLRTTLLPGLLAAVRRNVSRGADDLALVETGPVFLGRPPAGAGTPGPAVPPRPDLAGRPAPHELDALDAALPEQPTHLAVALTGARTPAGWWGPRRPAGWADAVEAARYLAGVLGAPATVARGSDAPFHPGRCAALLCGGAVVGHAGELHPRVVAAYGLPERACAAELDLDALLAAAADVVPAPALSPFPVAKEDVALVVGADVPAADVAAALAGAAGELCESVRLFDVYTGDQVPEGHRSLAFALRFRAADRTLTAADVAAARQAALDAAARACGAVLRGG